MKNLLFIITSLLSICFYAQQPNDCVNAIVVCGSGAINSNANGVGTVNEVSGCSSNEHNSVWIRIDIVQAGTLGFDIIPDNASITVDYDFWVYGPNKDCSNLTNAIRCSTTNPQASGASNNHTGMNTTETDDFEGPGPQGNNYVRALDVQVGEFYYIVLDRPIGIGGFSLNWTGTATLGTGAFPFPPAANPVTDLETCSSNGQANFNLGALRNSINPSTQVNIDFFESLANAVDDVQALPDVYTSTSPVQTITAKVTELVNQCTNYVEFDLIINSEPTVTVTPTEVDLCTPREIEINFTSSPDTEIDFLVGNQTQQVITDASGNATYSFTPTQNIEVELVQASQLENGVVICTGTLDEIITIEFNGLPEIENLQDLNKCDGDKNGRVIYDFTVNTNTVYTQFDNTAFEVLYFETQQNAELGVNEISSPTQYENTQDLPQAIWVRVQEIAQPNCYTVANFILNAYTDAPPTFTITKSNTGLLDQTKQIIITDISGIGPYEFRINNGPWISLPENQNTLTFDAIGNQTNVIQGRHTEGCGETIVEVNFINYPKFFTPNNDGNNDYWNITGLSEENFPAKIRIYDRFGKLLADLHPQKIGWDGNYGSKQMPANDYWFYVEYYETVSTGERVKRVYKKNFSLLR